ncbi:MAG: DNA polymerase III subunit delta' [Candidatus Competibacteraceae bacterium]|nr:DNA polymerase III subunit delta' [Candidatus Competibacteraceae bacterium]
MDERLPWHAPLWRRLQRHRADGRWPHALLLAGPSGLGKGSFARRLAASWCCARPEADGEACGRCQGCRWFQAGSHPDFSAVRPAEDGKTIKVDQIRELAGFLGLSARCGGCKIALLEPADRLNLNAANSLLKTLEEPPGDSRLLLVAAQPARLPATVRSRCQTLKFAPPPAEDAIAWLSGRIAETDARSALEVAGGAPLAALALAEPQRWNRRRQLAENYDRILKGAADPVRAAEAWLQGDVAENLRWLAGWHADLIRLKMGVEPPRLSHPDLKPVLRRWAAPQSARALFERLDAAVRLSASSSTAQISLPLALEAFFCESARVIVCDPSQRPVIEG